MNELLAEIDKQPITDIDDKLRKARIVTIISLVCNLVLAGLKIGFSIKTGSLSLLADGLDSALDIATTILGYVAIQIAHRPPDSDHHFGHEKFENFFSLGIAIILVASSGIIGFQAINKLIDRTTSEFSIANIVIASSSILLKGLLVWLNVSVGKRIESPSLIANGKNFRTDVLTSIVVLISVTIGDRSIGTFDLFWVDPTIALGISVIIIITAVIISKESAGVLLDQSPSESMIEEITEITNNQKGVKKIGNIKARKVGSNIFLVDIDIFLEPSLTIEEGHKIACQLEETLKEKLPIKYIQTHVEPYYEENI